MVGNPGHKQKHCTTNALLESELSLMGVCWGVWGNLKPGENGNGSSCESQPRPGLNLHKEW